ncbi:MAG TPA: glycosyltransferase family 4 protein [Bryobacteraceae bacterium]|nr:glycosyltransferase family 4 protein [Bryobacteraceae bacterium]
MPHKPVLLMVRALELGGSERQMADLARALDKSEFEVHVGCFHDDGFRAQELRQAGIPILALPVRSFLAFNALQGAWQMGQYIRRHGIQLVHTFDLPLTIFGVPVARAFGVPVVLSSQRANRNLQPRYHRLAGLTDHLAHGIVVNCEAMRVHMIEDEGAPPERVHVCLNWIDIEHYHPLHPLRPLPIADASLVIGVVCALRPEKGLLTLVDAFAQVRDTAPGLKLLIVGDGPMLPALEERVREYSLGTQCVFQPAVADVREWLREIDIFVLPSLSEALSNSLLEAMASGCTVVASRVGGNPELVQDGKTGLLFTPGDTGDLARQLRSLIASELLRKQLRDNSLAFVRENFNRDTSVHRIQELYRSFLA